MKRVRPVAVPASLLAAVLLAAPVPAFSAAIEHHAVGCMVAGRFPRLEARLVPADGVTRARVHFRPDGGAHWYSVPLAAEGDAFAAVLPRPTKKLKRLAYYLEVTDASLTPTRTQEYTAEVVGGPGACQDRKVAMALASAAVALEVPAGAAAIPAGFSAAGVTAAAGGSTGAAAGAAASGGAGGGGGLGTGVLVGAGVAAAAGLGLAVAAASGGDAGNVTHYDVTFVPLVDVSVCAGRNVIWTSQGINADQQGRFDETWAPDQPNTARFSGQVTDTAVSATLSCVGGGASAPFNASGSGGRYEGSFSFGGRSGTFTVTRRASP